MKKAEKEVQIIAMDKLKVGNKYFHLKLTRSSDGDTYKILARSVHIKDEAYTFSIESSVLRLQYLE